MDEFINEFKSEVTGIVNHVSHCLLSLEEDRQNRSLIDEVFRGVHTLKGSSRMFGFEQIETLTHELENSFAKVRDGELKLHSELINLGLEVMDAVINIIDGSFSDDAFRVLNQKLSHEDIGKEVKEDQNGGLFQVLYFPNENIYERGVKPLSVINEVEELGDVQINTVYQGNDFEIQEKNKCFESRFEILIHLTANYEDLEDVFIFFDENEYQIHEIKGIGEDVLSQLEDNVQNILGEISVNESFNDSRKAFIARYFKTSITSDLEIIHAEDDIEEEKPNENKSDISNQTKPTRSVDFINVRLDRLDQMMRLLSELVSVKAELNFRAEELQDNRLLASVERLDKIANKFKDNAFLMRLVPLQILSLKFQRLIRDISTKLGKEVKLITEGLDTEIDKSIISEIEAPLIHIIQNAIDHGIESPEERVAKGKSKEGLLKIVAFHSGANVFIMIQDDGKGMNLDKIRKKAIEKGLIDKKDILSEKDIIDLIFKPGLTTHSEATNYSGRGVGMDVVMQKIKLLRGSVEVTTEENLGSAFTIRLPLSLSIIDVLHVRIGGINYLIPQSEIEQCFSERLHSSAIKKQGFNLSYDGKLIPHIDLIRFFERTETNTRDHSIIIIQKNDAFISLEVEEIVGYVQLVVKPMDDAFSDLPYLTGVSVLGNGDLAFMLDGLRLRDFTNRKNEKTINESTGK